MNRLLLTALVLVGLLITSCDRPIQPPPARKRVIAVIPKGTTHEFWKSIQAGAMKAGQEFGAEIQWRGPSTEEDREQQIKVMEDFIAKGVSGIVLAPLDDTALRDSVATAVKDGIPVVIIDSDLKSDDYVSFVATDNFKAGQQAGKEMIRLLEGRGKVIVLRYQPGSASTTNRETGFLEALKDQPNIQVVSENQYGGATAESAQKKSENLLAPFKASDGSLTIDGIFCPNESTTFGMLRTLEEMKQTGKVKFVGFDASKKLVEGLQNGEIDALVVQNPMQMGYKGVRTMIEALHGDQVEKRIDTGSTVVTKVNMETPDVKELLHPPIEKYLKE